MFVMLILKIYVRKVVGIVLIISFSSRKEFIKIEYILGIGVEYNI